MTDDRDRDDESNEEIDPSDWLASQFDQPTEGSKSADAASSVPSEAAPAEAAPEPTTQLPSAESYFGTPNVPSSVPAAATPHYEPPPTQAFQQQPPFDPAIDGATEAIIAQAAGMPHPVDEASATSVFDSLLGEDRFVDPGATTVLPAADGAGAPPEGPADDPKGTKKRAPLQRHQKVLLWIAGSLIAVLALVALFYLGTRLSDVFGASPVATPTPTPTPTPTSTVPPVGPVEPGEHRWDALLGGECLEPFPGPWENEYTVIDCVTPHTAQMIARGEFAEDLVAPYPGVEELQSRINLLCTPPSIIDYSAAGAYPDIQVSASFAADEAQWAAGNRDYFCFVTRSSGESITGSVAIPQVAPEPEPES